MRLNLKRSLLVAAMMMLVATSVSGVCYFTEDTWCGFQCDWVGGGLYCFEPSNLDRCCWESGTGNACGEEAHCSQCSCTYPGGF